jgi:hypothetical protein
MFNAVKAYLKTEGKVDYRNCEIGYYTYSMFDVPNKFKVNVNVHIQSPKSDSIKSLALDDTFEKESDAINFGIDQGKAYIDKSYDSGKVTNIPQPDEKVKASKKK